MFYVGIIFRPRLTALFSSSFLFIVSLLSLQGTENCNALECFSKQGREKMAHGREKMAQDANFQTPTSTVAQDAK